MKVLETRTDIVHEASVNGSTVLTDCGSIFLGNATVRDDLPVTCIACLAALPRPPTWNQPIGEYAKVDAESTLALFHSIGTNPCAEIPLLCEDLPTSTSRGARDGAVDASMDKSTTPVPRPIETRSG